MNAPATNQQGVALQVRGLRKSFNGEEVLKGLDFDVSRARQLIADSSYRDVKNFPELVLTIMGNRTSAPPEIAVTWPSRS